MVLTDSKIHQNVININLGKIYQFQVNIFTWFCLVQFSQALSLVNQKIHIVDTPYFNNTRAVSQLQQVGSGKSVIQ